jgi:hypothetical protein
MQVIIKEWPNKTATIMTDAGQVVWTFSSASEARQACSEWHNLVDGEPVVVHDGEEPDPESISTAA